MWFFMVIISYIAKGNYAPQNYKDFISKPQSLVSCLFIVVCHISLLSKLLSLLSKIRYGHLARLKSGLYPRTFTKLFLYLLKQDTAAMKTLRPALLFIILSFSILAKADESLSRKGWYVGVGTGIPFSASSFSSFAPNGPYAGWTTSLYGGYNFNEFLGMEVDLGFGRSNLAARNGCIGNNYYLGADNVLYYSAPLGIESWSVSELKTRVSYKSIGLCLNFNLLGLFPALQTRWSLCLSPRIGLYSTSRALLHLSGCEIIRPEREENLHFAYGAFLKIGYQLSRIIGLGLSSGLTSLTGKGLDGIPDHGHNVNLIWENTLRLTFNLSRNRKRFSSQDSGNFYEQSPAATNTVRAVYLPAREDYSIAPAPLQAAASLAELAPRQTLPEIEYIYF